MTNDLIQQAKASVPFWMMQIQNFDGLEIQPVMEGSAKTGRYCEPCGSHEAHFWSVYGHCKSGGVECFDDFSTVEAARVFAAQLLQAYPHLRKHGLGNRR